MAPRIHERTRDRISAVQVLYTSELTGKLPSELLDCGLCLVAREAPADETDAAEAGAFGRIEEGTLTDYALALIHGVEANQAQVDERIEAASENWALSRMPIVDYSEMAFYHMLEKTAPNCNLISFCDRKVLDLNKYDERHGTELIKTLQVYLDHCKDLNSSAAILNVHKNTVRYRIAKCLELLGSDLENGAEIFSILFSIRVLHYCNTLNRIPNDPEAEEF